MTHFPARNEGALPKASRELALLEGQAAELRAMLIHLQAQVSRAEGEILDGPRGQLVQVNEQLVLAVIKAQQVAETATQELQDASRAFELDALTQLPTRHQLLKDLDKALSTAHRKSNRFALLFIDLNNFKQVNDTLGHASGDVILRLAADRLATCVGANDSVGRYGGDEFLIILTEVPNTSTALAVADAVVLALGTPHRIGSHVIRLTASIGISLFPDDGEDADTLIDLADVAMYHAKRRGLSSFAFHGMEPTGHRTWEVPALESLLHPVSGFDAALEENERRYSNLREANEKLLLAALDAQDLQSAAELANKTLTSFLATVAHELRNPLAPIRNAAAMMSGVRPDELPRLQAVIERQGAHMARLVGDLIDVSRVNTGKLRIQLQEVDLATIIDTAIEACRPAMDVRLQTFVFQLDGPGLKLNGDPVRLAQVVINLLDNASKYTPDGGEISLRVVHAGATIVLTVSDSGIGISNEALPQIFAPFVQDPLAVVFNGAGLGIGLTVVREIVEAHGGSVVARTDGIHRGSQFVVTLPLVARPAHSARQ